MEDAQEMEEVLWGGKAHGSSTSPSLEEVRAAMLVLQDRSSSPAGAAGDRCERLLSLGGSQACSPPSGTDRLRCEGVSWELGREPKAGPRLVVRAEVSYRRGG